MNTLDYAPIYAPPPTSPPTPENKIVLTAADRAFAAEVSEYWFQFARTGSPSCAGSPHWPQTTSETDNEHSNTLVLGNAEATDKGEITLSPDFMKTHMSDFTTIGNSYDLFILGRP
jgi:carboxylesterase type B